MSRKLINILILIFSLCYCSSVALADVRWGTMTWKPSGNGIWYNSPVSPLVSIDGNVTDCSATSSMLINGTREVGATVEVSSAEATVGSVIYPDTSTWQAALPSLTQGDNTISVVGTDSEFRTTTVDKVIRYSIPDLTLTTFPVTLPASHLADGGETPAPFTVRLADSSGVVCDGTPITMTATFGLITDSSSTDNGTISGNFEASFDLDTANIDVLHDSASVLSAPVQVSMVAGDLAKIGFTSETQKIVTGDSSGFIVFATQDNYGHTVSNDASRVITMSASPPGLEFLDEFGSWVAEIDFSLNGSGDVFKVRSFTPNEYIITALNPVPSSGTPSQLADGTHSISVLPSYGSQPGFAILTVGKLNNDSVGLASHSKTADGVYQHLRNRNFSDEQILYFNPDLQPHPGEDEYTNSTYKLALQETIESAFLNTMYSTPGPLYIVLVGHGASDGRFYLEGSGSGQYVTSGELDQWLDTREDAMASYSPPIEQDIVVVIGTCYSGKFIPVLSKSNSRRILVTSTSPLEKSFRGPQDPTVFEAVADGEFFVSTLFNEWARNKPDGSGVDLETAFTKAVNKTKVYTNLNPAVPIFEPPYFDTAAQHPRLDDNGINDNIELDEFNQGSYRLVAGKDGDKAKTLLLGLGEDVNVPPVYTAVGRVADVAAGEENISATLQAWVASSDRIRVASAWAEVRAPNQTLNLSETGNQVWYSLSPVELNKAPDPYSVIYNQFNEAGRYAVFFYLKDHFGVITGPEVAYVYKNVVGNSALPTAPVLVSPATLFSSTTVKGLPAMWQASSDDHSVTYSVEITGTTDTSFKYKKEGIPKTFTNIGIEANFQNNHHYEWKVTAVDMYGQSSSSETRSFSMTDQNAFDGTIWGYITDIDTGGLISSATVVQPYPTGVYGPTSPAGSYILYAPAYEGFNLTINASGYTSKVVAMMFNETVQERHIRLKAAVASDGDSDGVADLSDNCPGLANANQADLDADGTGDVCDVTIDNNLKITGTKSFYSTGTVTTDGPVTIDSDGDLILQSDKIILKPGFHAKSGSSLHVTPN